VGNDFGVRIRRELVPARLEALLERAGVLNDAIVDDRDIPLAVDVRVRIALVRNGVWPIPMSPATGLAASARSSWEIFPAALRVSTPPPFITATPAES